MRTAFRKGSPVHGSNRPASGRAPKNAIAPKLCMGHKEAYSRING